MRCSNVSVIHPAAALVPKLEIFQGDAMLECTPIKKVERSRLSPPSLIKSLNVNYSSSSRALLSLFPGCFFVSRQADRINILSWNKMKQLFSGRRTEEDAVVCVSYVIKARLWTNPYLLDSAKKECQISGCREGGRREGGDSSTFLWHSRKNAKSRNSSFIFMQYLKHVQNFSMFLTLLGLWAVLKVFNFCISILKRFMQGVKILLILTYGKTINF